MHDLKAIEEHLRRFASGNRELDAKAFDGPARPRWTSPPPCEMVAFSTPGTPIYAIDDRQNVIRGVVHERHGAYVTLETNLGPCRRRRVFHARYVQRDIWREMETLP